MERNRSAMKGLACCLICLLVFCPQVGLAQTRIPNLSPNLFGSVSQGTPASAPMSLSIADAIDRAMKYNLGSIISEQETRISRAARVRALSELLPKITANISETIQQTNLAAFGFEGFSGVPPIIGPFSVFDVRARYTHTAFDSRFVHELRSASEEVEANNYSEKDV